MNRESGSIWRKWDLHVHTPESIVQNYSGWDRFLGDLEALPEAFSVVGINDYLFLDGYRRVLKERASGRLRNLDLVLPVLEFRLPIFGGTDSALRRVNLHVIFSEEVDPDLIEAQFLNALTSGFQLSPGHSGLKWKGVITRESLVDLGAQIKKTVPPEKLKEYGSDLEEGFNNLTVTFGNVRAALDKPFFKNRFRIAVGKAEWADIKWTNSSIANKKDVINSADLVFTAAATPSQWRAAREALRDAHVNDQLLDCSDAHNHSNSDQKDRIGNCFTWINADPTFEGLCHALHEFDGRVFVGDEPPKIRAVGLHSNKYFETVEIRKTVNATLPGIWFDCRVPLNPGFVAVIGNKGKGKSALTDVIGLLASSRNQDSFSFLSRERFRNPQANKAREFKAILTWHSGEK